MTAQQLFKHKCIFGMIHCAALPSTRDFTNMAEVKARALADAEVFERAGIDAVIVENMNDIPAAKTLGAEQLAALSATAALVKERVSMPLGIDAMFSDYRAALAIAVAVGADFVRIPVFTDTVVAASGVVEPCASEALRYRRALGADHILLLCDIQPKHSFMLVDSITLRDSAEMAQQNGADAVIVTGGATGSAASLDDIKSVKRAVDLPVVVGSGVSAANAAAQLAVADGAIVGSAFKEGGVIASPVKLELVEQLLRAARA